MEMEMESRVDSMAAAYDELVDAVAALIAEPVRTPAAINRLNSRLHAFVVSCDRADDLVAAATNQLALHTGAAAPPPSPGTGAGRLDALLQALQAISPEDLQAKDTAAADNNN
uniref:Uncharacterized protein n=1 Tax=Leersia perrieri TaxID=77586 RepID=A0A0D9VN06_9ORYZ